MVWEVDVTAPVPTVIAAPLATTAERTGIMEVAAVDGGEPCQGCTYTCVFYEGNGKGGPSPSYVGVTT